jgi:hypothetical protein
VSELPEVQPLNYRKFSDQTSVRVKTNISNTSAKGAAAVETSDEIDAVACEVVDAIIELVGRVQTDYPEERAWGVARELATEALTIAGGRAAAARELLLRAIADRRLARATNPVGLLTFSVSSAWGKLRRALKKIFEIGGRLGYRSVKVFVTKVDGLIVVVFDRDDRVRRSRADVITKP